MPTRWKGSNFSPRRAPCAFTTDHDFRIDRRLNLSMFLAAARTAARKWSSALIEELRSSAVETSSRSGVSFAPSNRSVSSIKAASPPARTDSTISRARSSMVRSNRLEPLMSFRICSAKLGSLNRAMFIAGADATECAGKCQNGVDTITKSCGKTAFEPVPCIHTNRACFSNLTTKTAIC